MFPGRHTTGRSTLNLPAISYSGAISHIPVFTMLTTSGFHKGIQELYPVASAMLKIFKHTGRGEC
jgi:hypothetical protein